MADVLIVEDTGLQAALIKGFLSDTHTVVGTAETADQAVDLTRETDPDVVVMDLRLEEGTGVEATERIGSIRPGTAVVVSTVSVSQEIKLQVFEAGADKYLTKPYSKDELLTAIEECLE
jgi:two-component system chemotaxis response regulator CheY